MELIKQKFFELIENAKKMRLYDLLEDHEITPREFKKECMELAEQYPQIMSNALTWAEEYKDLSMPVLFERGEEIENPLEIFAIISIINDYDVTECEIFADSDEFVDTIKEIGDENAEALADVVSETLIYEI